MNDIAEQRPSDTESDPATPPAPVAPETKPGAAPRVGAPAGNTNRTVHGLHGSALPKDARRLASRLSAFRRSLCEAVEARAGSIDLHAAATIDSAAQWQRHALLAARWLRLQHDDLEPDQRLAFSREVAKASTERDRCIRLLKLDQPADAFDPASFYKLPLPASVLPPPGDEYSRPHPGAIPADDAAEAKFGGQTR